MQFTKNILPVARIIQSCALAVVEAAAISKHFQAISNVLAQTIKDEMKEKKNMSELTLLLPKSQLSITISRSAMLPKFGRGGYATLGGRACISRYDRAGPVPIVDSIPAIRRLGDRKRSGRVGRFIVLSLGIPGLRGDSVKPTCKGTKGCESLVDQACLLAYLGDCFDNVH